ncbi:MAG: GAF domain-containing sensor histidine kinase [Candidatus Marinimicrobia bacterium]|nr:GAF domain-containing sensor histidine kinase [Candidatus Neomarinimicrobiota bacterium]
MHPDSVEWIVPDTERPLSAAARRVLDHVNDQIAAGDSLEAVMTFLFETTRAVFPCDRLGLAFLENEDRRLVTAWVRADYAPLRLGPGYADDLRTTSLPALFTTPGIRLIHDLAQYVHCHPGSRASRLLLAEGVRSSLVAPLRVGERRVGVLFRSARRPHAYDADSVRMHQALAERLGQAVELARRLEQLAASTHAAHEMLGVVSHELKSPLAALTMQLDALAAGLHGPVNDRQRETLERLAKRTRQVLALNQEYLDFARVAEGEPELQWETGLRFGPDLLEPVLELLEPRRAQRECPLETEFAPGLTVAGDAELLRVVLRNLVGNAIKYARVGGRVIVRALHQDQNVQISVWNEGPGFKPEEEKLLFRRFSRLPDARRSRIEGTGLGLYTAWRIVHRHGGRLTARAEPGRWAEFTCLLPDQAP